MKILSFAALLFLFFSCTPSTQKSPVDTLFQDYMDAYYELNPLQATADGINDYNDKLAIDIGPEYITNSIELNEKYLDLLKKLNPKDLTEQQKLSVEILKYRLTAATAKSRGSDHRR